jgi:hypothetical protein
MPFLSMNKTTIESSHGIDKIQPNFNSKIHRTFHKSKKLN